MRKLILKWLLGRDFDESRDILDLAMRVNTDARSVIKTMGELLEDCKDVNNQNKRLIEMNEKLLKENAQLDSEIQYDKLYIAHLEEENAKLKMDDEDDIK